MRRWPRPRPPGRRPTGRRSPRRCDPVGTTRTVLPASASTWSATGRMFLLLGRITTSAEPTDSTAFTRSAVAGFMVCPPTTRWWTPSERKMRPMPSPETTATTLVVGGGPVALAAGSGPRRAHALAHPALLLDLLVEVGHPDPVRPARVHAGLDGRADVVGVDVAVPQPVAADHHDGVADAGPHLLERLDGVVGRATGST